MKNGNARLQGVGMRASVCAPESDTLNFGDIVRWTPSVICVRMEESAGALFRVGCNVELRVYTVYHAEVMTVVVAENVKGVLSLRMQPGCRVERDVRLARWQYCTPVEYRVTMLPPKTPGSLDGIRHTGMTYDISHTGLAVRADYIPVVGAELELWLALGSREVQASGIVRNNRLRGANSFGLEFISLSRVDSAVLRAFLHDYKQEAA
jgi:hypothetical protein